MIEAKNLTKSFQTPQGESEYIFKNLNFHAKKGEFTVIQGKSGSGKTTLLNIISTIDAIDKNGSLVINNIETKHLSEYKRAKFRATNIGFIFQSYALIPEFSVLDNCIIPLTMSGIPKKEAKTRAKKIIKELIDDANESFYAKFPAQLSGGQQQRVAIARALIHNPPIIIADEPTANLDAVSATEVKIWLKKLSQQGICVVVVTHEKDYLNYADILYEFRPDTSTQAKSILSEAICLKNLK